MREREQSEASQEKPRAISRGQSLTDISQTEEPLFYLAGLTAEALHMTTEAVTFLKQVLALQPLNDKFSTALRCVAISGNIRWVSVYASDFCVGSRRAAMHTSKLMELSSVTLQHLWG